MDAQMTFNLQIFPRPAPHLSSISLSNVTFCVLIYGTRNWTFNTLRGFKKRRLTIHFLRGWAAPVIRKVRVLCYEFTDVTLAWDNGQWVEAHKYILAGCSPNPHFQLNGSFSDVQKTKTKTTRRSSFWLRVLKWYAAAKEISICKALSEVN